GKDGDDRQRPAGPRHGVCTGAGPRCDDCSACTGQLRLHARSPRSVWATITVVWLGLPAGLTQRTVLCCARPTLRVGARGTHWKGEGPSLPLMQLAFATIQTPQDD